MREQKPEELAQAQIDLSTLSAAELAIMVKLVESGRLRAASSDERELHRGTGGARRWKVNVRPMS